MAPVPQNASFVVVQSTPQISPTTPVKVPLLAEDTQQVPPDVKFGTSLDDVTVFPNVHCSPALRQVSAV